MSARGAALARWIVAASVVCLAQLGVLTPAFAAEQDQYDRYDVDYVVAANGTTQVTETVTLRFGSSSGRRGLERDLPTREQYDDDQDVIFEIPQTSIEVSSPDPGVSTATTVGVDDEGREQGLRLRVGDANRRISAPTATYVIEYTVKGYVRTSDNTPQLYVDALGSRHPAVRSSTVTITVPGGVRRTECFTGTARSTTGCASVTVDAQGKATFRAANIADGELLTVGAAIAPGQVADPYPILVERYGAAQERARMSALGAGAGAAALVPLGGWLYYRRRGRDDRFAGLPPGTFPLPGSAAAVVRNDRHIEVPVAFSPPRLPLMDAGYLLDRASSVHHLTATLVGLAVAGAVRLQGGRDERPAAIAQDPARAPDDPSRALYQSLFGAGEDAVALDVPGDMAAARSALFEGARRTAEHNGWFRSLPRGGRTAGGLGLLWVVLLALAFGVSTGPLLWFAVPVAIAVTATLLVVHAKLSKGQRSATGRALTDQIEGFRTYLATAEAEQLTFEEGEDIFSKYLPWAILFGLATRWVQVCQQAVELGVLHEPSSAWYGAAAWDPTLMLWNLSLWDSGVQSAAVAPPVDLSPSNLDFGSGSGFGGGSAFGGGGFSGGGFGGGGSGSW